MCCFDLSGILAKLPNSLTLWKSTLGARTCLCKGPIEILLFKDQNLGSLWRLIVARHSDASPKSEIQLSSPRRCACPLDFHG